MIQAPLHDPSLSGLPTGRAPRIGMVGGGQLSRMAHAPATALGLDFRVLSASGTDAAALVVRSTVVGDERGADDVLAFARGCDAITFDHEHVPHDVIRAVEASGVAVRPSAAALVHAQDKAVMRARLDALDVPMPRYRIVSDAQEVADVLREWGAVVLKALRGGYDGRGVWLIDGDDGDADEAGVAEALATGPAILAEERVDFVRELSALVVRGHAGQAVAYPVVESVQSQGICVEVIAPAPGLDADIALAAQRLALSIADALGVVGVLAVELFETADGHVLVNELAMRPHNTGHWSIEGAVTSQFENHLRAVAGLPLGSPRARSPWAVMVNVLGGDPATAGDLHQGLLHCLARDPGLKVHLYGKEVRRGRKVGHVTVCGDDLADLRRRAKHAADYLAGAIDE